MTPRDKPTLKSYFEQGDVPTQQQFEDLIDSIPDAGQTGVPSSRVIYAQLPLKIDNEAAADLTQDRTLSILPATNTNAGSMSASDKAKLDSINGSNNGGSHNTTHESGGDDEISVDGLLGLLAEPQIPVMHTHGGEEITSAILHTHDGEDNSQIDHTNLVNKGTNAHSAIDTALTRLANTSGSNTGDQTLESLGAAPTAKGVTNGDSHDHNGGDGATIDHVNLSNKGTNTHSAIDTALARLANTSGINTGNQDLSNLVSGPASSVADRFVAFNGISGKIIADSGYAGSSFAASNHAHYAQTSLYAYGCRAYQTSNFSVANDSWGVSVAFQSSTNFGCNWDSGNAIYVYITGWYLVTGNVLWSASATNTTRLLAIHDSNNIYYANTGAGWPSSSQGTNQSVSAIIYLAANQYVQLNPYQNSGGALNVNANTTHRSYFSVVLIGL